MQQSRHSIGSIRVQVRGAGREQAWPLRQELDVLLRDFCDAELETLLDELDLPGKHITIPRLEIDLGKVVTATLRDQLDQRLRAVLETYRFWSPESGGAEIVVVDAGPERPEALIQPLALRQQDWLLHYLRYGYFPWGISGQELRDLLAAFRSDPVSFLSQADPDMLLQENVLRRIVQDAGISGFGYLLELLYERWRQMKLPDILLQAYTPAGIRTLFPDAQFTENNCIRILLFSARSCYEAQSSVRERQWYIAGQNLYRLYQLAEMPVSSFSPELRSQLLQVSGLPEPAIKEVLLNSPIREHEVAEPVIVPFLGLVLLHPFLPAFLSGLDLLDTKQRFLSDIHRMTALGALLQLCCGHTDLPEYHMLFPKLLLGIPLDTVPERSLWEEKRMVFEEEALALLQSVIGHWTALRSTSVQGLRDSFLQRQGRLHTEDGIIKLRIERSGFDMLLDRLPWSYSEIHLPWIKQSIWTEW